MQVGTIITCTWLHMVPTNVVSGSKTLKVLLIHCNVTSRKESLIKKKRFTDMISQYKYTLVFVLIFFFCFDSQRQSELKLVHGRHPMMCHSH